MQTTRESQAGSQNPMLRSVELPFSGTYYPAGFPVELASNSRDVMESASESWGRWAAEFAPPPVKLRVIVQPGDSLAAPPSLHRHGHVFCMVSDAENFAVADLRSLEGCVFLSTRTAADHGWLRWFFLEALGYILLAQRYVVPVHAACVAHQGTGLLLCGPSGAGKSTLSFGCARAGWTFVSDDATWLLPDSPDPVAIGRPHQARFRMDTTRLFPELAGYADAEHPNGKLSIEVPLEELDGIHTTSRCGIGALVILDRDPGGTARTQAIAPGEVIDLLRQDEASWGVETDALHFQTIQKLARIPAWRLSYAATEDGIRLLDSLVAPGGYCR